MENQVFWKHQAFVFYTTNFKWSYFKCTEGDTIFSHVSFEEEANNVKALLF